MKKKGIVFCIPGYGHVNPTLPVVKELVDRGHELDYCCMEEFRELIEGTGAKFIPFPYDVSYTNSEKFNLLNIFADVVQYTYMAMDQLQNLVLKEKYDYILVDYYTLWGRVLAYHLRFPVVILNPTFAMHKDLKEPTQAITSILKMPLLSAKGGLRMLRYYNKIKKKYRVPKGGLNGLLKNLVEVPHICFTSKELQPQLELFPDNYYFTGSNVNAETRRSVNDFPIEKLKKSEKTIYVSLGSVVINKRFLQCCIDAFSNTDYLVVLNIGKVYQPSEFQTPNNFIVCNFAPQLEIFPYVNGFISHAGMNSAHEGILFEIPIIAAPQASDQFLVAQTIVAKKIGAWVNSNTVTPTELLKVTNEALTNKEVKVNLHRISQSLKKAGGKQKTADLIEKLVIN
jgi:MGT family glycosyltransferase